MVWAQVQREGLIYPPRPPLSFYGRTRKTDRRPLSTKKFRNGCLPPVSNSQALVKTCVLSGDSGGPKNAGGGEKHYGLRTSRNDELVRLTVAQTVEAERNAFFEGARLGLELGRAEQRANAEYQAISDTLKSSVYGEICNALKKNRPKIVSSVTI